MNMKQTRQHDIPFANEEILVQVQQLQEAKNFSEAIVKLKHLLNHAPHYTEAQHCLGLTYAKQGDIHSAIDAFKTALIQKPQDSQLHTNLGHAYKQLQHIPEAMTHYKKALEYDPSYPIAHNNLANLYTQQDNYTEALYHYHQAVQAAPDYIDAHYNLGLFFLKHHNLAAARIEFNNVIELKSDHVQAFFYLGLLALQEEDFNRAEQFFLHTLILRSEHIESLVNLGVIALKRAQAIVNDTQYGQRAIDYFTKALVLNPDHIEARNNLAATFLHYDRYENALTYYRELLALNPTNPEYLYNAGVAFLALGQLAEAQRNFETILANSPNDYPALCNLAAVHMRQGERNSAIHLLRQACALNANDSVSRFMLQALTGEATSAVKCPEYVKLLFNSYALYFDKHLQETLNYNLPEHIHRILHQLNLGRRAKTLDLGCGTGLSGLVLRAWTDHLIGVDIAEKMLAQAKTKNIYDTLCHEEILDFLLHDEEHYDLIVSADVLPYFGDLNALFEAIAARLTARGYFIFTCETSDQEPWQLQETIRFKHHPEYVHTVCNQATLDISYEEAFSARHQAHSNLPMTIFVVRPTIT